MKRLLLALALLCPASAWAQCSGTIIGCPAAVSLQSADVVLGWQTAQNPHTRSITISQIVGGGFPGVFSTLAVSATGIYTGTATNYYLSSLLNGIVPRTEYLSQHATADITQANIGGVAIPGSSTIGEADAFYGYVNNSSTATNGVGIGIISRALVAGTHNWGANIVVSDGNFASPTIIGNEYDIGCFNTGSHCFGENIIGVFDNGTPAEANAIQVSQQGGHPWQYSLVSYDGSATNLALVGTQTTAAGSNGQLITFNARDGGNTVRQCTIQATPGTSWATLVLNCGTSGNINVGSGIGFAPAAQLARALTSQDGGASSFALIGSQTSTANSDGQLLTFNARDSGNAVRQCTQQAQHTGTTAANLVLGCGTTGQVVSTSPLQLAGFATVASLPTCDSTRKGDVTIVSDANAPTWNSALSGGGAVVAGAKCNGSSWVAF